MQLEVLVAGGTVRGSEIDGVGVFLGIPYAAPPFGPHRFRDPQPVSPWDGVRAATAYGPTAPHAPYPAPLDELLPEPTIPGEECLNLNVWTPETAGSGLPVLVWIHGGAFVNGSGAVEQYSGAAFARDGVVAVTINYRLGVEGFAHFDDGGPTNLGLRDQIAALTWVAENIAAFGGDPAAVTIAGESAGAMSVAALLSSKAASGLFRAAIAQSGAGNHALSSVTARGITGLVAEHLGIDPTRAAFAAVDPVDLLAAQLAVSQALQGVPDPAKWGEAANNLMAFEPVIDGDLLGDLPLAAIRAGDGADVPVLTGTNLDEQRLFLVPTGILDFIDDNLLAMAAGAYGLTDELLAAYRPGNPTPGDVLVDFANDWFFRIPAIRLAEARSASPTYLYEFRWPSSAYDGKLGACHALEIGFVFDTYRLESGADPLAGQVPPTALAEEMHGAWVRFISTGDPGWPAYSSQDRTVRIFGDPHSDATTEVDPRGDRRIVWDGLR